MRLRKTLGTLVTIIEAFFVIITVWLFLVFPRVVNQLADQLGNMGNGEPPLNVNFQQGAIHFIVAAVISVILAYFFVWLPTKRLRETLETPGLKIRKGEGQAFIDTESVRQQVLLALSKVADIHRADVIVKNEAGKAIIQLNLITDISLNGPQKKNEINREVRKIVQDQLGLEISGKPTIHFSLTPVAPEVPLIGSGDIPRAESRTTPASSPVRTTQPVRPIVTEPEPDEEMDMPEPEDEPIEPPVSRPTGIELARNDPLARGRSSFFTPNTPSEPTPVAPSASDEANALPPLPSEQRDVPPSETSAETDNSTGDSSNSQLASEA